MIDYQRLFHTGFIVRDLGAAMEWYGASLGLTWAQRRVLEPMRLWRPGGGYEELRLEYVYSREGPQHVELLKGSPDSYYDPATQSGFHVGLWVDDVGVETAVLGAKGWTVVASGAAPDEGYGLFSYVLPPGGGMVVELVSHGLLPGFQAWWAGEVP